MIRTIIDVSVRQPLIVLLGTLGLIVWGLVSLQRLPLDAIPDVINNQVVVATQSPNLSAVEMEQFVTYPIEIAMRNIQGLEGIRSVSQFGLSIVTLDFKENTDLYFARNQVNERLLNIRQEIPQGFGTPTMNPITTGLGEIFQYVIKPVDPADTSWTPMELRTIQDWIVKKQLLGTEGVAEISSFGGYLKQYHIKVDPALLRATGASLGEVFHAVEQGNENTGAAYLEKDAHNYFIRGIGLARNPRDLEQVVVRVNGGTPVLVRDVATVETGSAVRYGALTQGGGEAVGGIVLMLKGENSRNVVLNVKERLKSVEGNLPKGLKVEAFLDRELLIDRTIATVSKNLLEGGVIVVFVLVLLLGHLRAGLIVASVIPLSMLFAIGCMVAFKVSGNLMSLGAIDFGLIVDGAVIIVENIIRLLGLPRQGESKQTVISRAAGSMAGASFFGQIIILIVYVPLLTLSGVEGKMFQPMALTVIFALAGAVILSLTYVPAVSALLFKEHSAHEENFADRLMRRLAEWYRPMLEFGLHYKKLVLAFAVSLLVIAFALFSRMGGEFIPQLDEGDFVIEVRMLPGSSLSAMIRTAEHASREIQATFPDEVRVCTGKIGTSEVPMDPMSIEEMDLTISMFPREQWKKVHSRAEFEEKLQEVLNRIPGVFTSIQQPIAMRFNELMSGAKTDMIVQILGPDLEQLAAIGHRIEKEVKQVPGAADVSVAKAEGLPQMFVEYRRDALARYGISIGEVNMALQTAIAGQKAGTLFEGDRRFDVVVKLRETTERPLDILQKVMVSAPGGLQVPLTELAEVGIKDGPMAVNRVDGERCVNVALNVRGRDIQSVVADVQARVQQKIPLPEGYRVTYGGQFENLQNAQARLGIVVPVALGLILLLLYFSFGRVRESLLIFSAIPFAAVGGVLALWLRDMPFSISAGVGFIALFGVAVLNGMVLIGYFQQLEQEGVTDALARIREGVMTRFRPVIMTASVASLGFLPMAIASGAGAEVQKPLATVVIGGLISATLLTLVILPVLYAVFAGGGGKKRENLPPVAALLLAGLVSVGPAKAQTRLTETQALEMALQHHPLLQQADFRVAETNALANTNMPLPPLQLYTWQPFNPEVGVIQNFHNPSLVRTDRQMRQAASGQASAERTLTEQSVRREVLLAFDACLHQRERLQLLTRQDSLLADYLRIADIEFRSGNISGLARLNLETRAREAGRLRRQAEAEYSSAVGVLRLLTGSTDSLLIPEGALEARTLPPGSESEAVLEAWAQQKKQVAALEVKKAEKAVLPGFGLGIVTNVDPYNRFLPNAYFSVNIPVFRKAYRAETEAARARQLQTEAEYQVLRQNTDVQAEKARRQWLQARNELDYWEQFGAPQARALLQAAELSRKAGESNATEYLQALVQAFTLENNRLDALRLLNEASIHLQFKHLP
jgi:heavy metal efflux system protein